MIDTRDTLRGQHDLAEEWDKDPIYHRIIEVLSLELNEDNYRKYSPEQAVEIIKKNLSDIQCKISQRKIARIIRAVEKKDNIKDIMIYLGEVILSD